MYLSELKQCKMHECLRYKLVVQHSDFGRQFQHVTLKKELLKYFECVLFCFF